MCDKVMAVLSQELEGGNIFPKAYMFSEPNCEGNIKAFSIANSQTWVNGNGIGQCNNQGNFSNEIWDYLDWGVSSKYVKSWYIPPMMLVNFETAVFSQDAHSVVKNGNSCCKMCRNDSAQCDNFCCKRLNVCNPIELDGQYKNYMFTQLKSLGSSRTPLNCDKEGLQNHAGSESGYDCGYTICQWLAGYKAGEISWDCYLATCPSSKSDNPLANMVMFAANAESSQKGCGHTDNDECHPDKTCSNLGPKLSLTTTKIKMTNQWESLSQFKVALCMGKITNDPYMPQNFVPQSADCDSFMNDLCKTQSTLYTTECSCIRNSDEILLKYDLLEDELGITAACFTATCGTSESYQTKVMTETTCNSTVCSEFIELNGENIVASGQNEVVCDNQTYNLPGSTATPSSIIDDEQGFNNTELAFVIGIGILFVIVFFYWLYRFLRKKYA
jgi:hypothetical protein